MKQKFLIYTSRVEDYIGKDNGFFDEVRDANENKDDVRKKQALKTAIENLVIGITDNILNNLNSREYQR